MLLRETGSGTRELFDHTLAALEYTYTPAWESTSTAALIKAACQGLGIAILPYMMVQEELEKGNVIELQVEKLHLDRGLHIIYHKNKRLTNLAGEFLAMCQNTGTPVSQ